MSLVSRLRTRFKMKVLASVAAILSASSPVMADTIAVTNTSAPFSCGAGCFTWEYEISEDLGGRITSGAAPGETTTATPEFLVADYFTIYDFHGFIPGSDVAPNADWIFQQLPSNLGSTPDNVTVTDGSSAVNLTWYYVGAAPLPPGVVLTGFSANSTIGAIFLGEYSSEDTNDSPLPLIDGTRGSGTGNVGTPLSPVPEPTTLLLMGSGLLSMGIFRRKKSN